MDIWGLCSGRYTRRNKLTPKAIEADLLQLPDLPDFKSQNARTEYGKAYREEAAKLTVPKDPLPIEVTCKPPQTGRQEAIILGSAGQRIITAGELFCLAGASAGCHATQKNDYPITVMKGHSVSEIIMADEKIEYTGIENPSAVIALAPEGVNRRKKMLAELSPETVIIKTANVELPPCPATIIEVDFKAQKIRPQDWALAALAILAKREKILTMEMLTAALRMRFQKTIFDAAMGVLDKISALDG